MPSCRPSPDPRRAFTLALAIASSNSALSKDLPYLTSACLTRPLSTPKVSAVSSTLKPFVRKSQTLDWKEGSSGSGGGVGNPRLDSMADPPSRARRSAAYISAMSLLLSSGVLTSILSRISLGAPSLSSSSLLSAGGSALILFISRLRAASSILRSLASIDSLNLLALRSRAACASGVLEARAASPLRLLSSRRSRSA